MRRCRARLPGFPIGYTGVSLAYSRALLAHDCVRYFNLLQPVLVGRRGRRFLRAAQARGRKVLVWTVNAEEWMDWGIREGVDGVITDDPATFSGVQKRWAAWQASHPAAAAPDTPHPPGTPTVTGRYLRRWARLFAFVALVRVLEQVANVYMRAKYGLFMERTVHATLQ